MARENGIKVNYERETDEELETRLAHAVERREIAQRDIDRIMGHIGLRMGGYTTTVEDSLVLPLAEQQFEGQSA